MFNVICCSIIGLFKISKPITNPNPGTKSFPFGTDGCCVLDVLPLDVFGGGGTLPVGCDDDVVADDDGVDDSAFGASAVGGGGAGGSGGGAGGSGGGAIGLIGLVGFVTFVMLFSHEFTVSTQGPASGGP